MIQTQNINLLISQYYDIITNMIESPVTFDNTEVVYDCC